ncbi:hypothetical protein Tdes44962_MAKER10406 [Teratosphaeria destructans]|uniref:Uncharacterized protein n=1 Tax=Teratosphaeria destructans TaxID=418781 RepID=A0A9W7SIR7_9PEZI|nr:hypothetical protein Tdes44962_MAKER10406 [Teratosphaeria destructans]
MEWRIRKERIIILQEPRAFWDVGLHVLQAGGLVAGASLQDRLFRFGHGLIGDGLVDDDLWFGHGGGDGGCDGC